MIRDALSWIYEQVQWGPVSLGALLVEFVPIALLASALVSAVFSVFGGGGGQMMASVPNTGSSVTLASYTRPPPPSPGKGAMTSRSTQPQPSATAPTSRQQRTVAAPVQPTPRRQVPVSDNVIPFDPNTITEDSTTTEVYVPSGPTH